MKKEVDYHRPPVNEVILGLTFDRLSNFKTAHFGKFWDVIGSDYYTTTEDMPPLLSPNQIMDFNNPLARVWYVSEDSKRLVQLQQDRIFYNWRRASESDHDYPEFSNIMPMFLESFKQFDRFVGDSGIADEIVVDKFELSYVNILRISPEVPGIARLGDILVDHVRSAVGPRFLPEADDVAWATIYPLPAQMGTLMVEARSAMRIDGSEEKLIQLTLTARGTPDPNGPDGIEAIQKWFDMAHFQIVRAFADVTDLEMQRIAWGRKW